MSRSNEQWARKLIDRFDPSYRPRWEVFDKHVEENAGSSKICLNIGSGIKQDPEFFFDFRLCIDTDILYPEDNRQRTIPFVQSDLNSLPFRDVSFDIVLLRFVVEHLRDPGISFHEIYRVLKKYGKVVIITTNKFSPLILLARLIPYSLRKTLMQKIYGVHEEDIFPTYHRFNTLYAVKRLAPNFKIIHWEYLQDANWNRHWLFMLMFLFHLKTKWLGLKFLRSNFITILEKTTIS